jgi:photosystem II stability/assembly factor-like uncharacterized protein
MLTGYFNAVLSDQGKPILATITVFAAGTETKVTIWANPEGTIQKDNPFQTDSLGRFQFFAENGTYDIEVSGLGITTYKIENVSIGGYGEGEVDYIILLRESHGFNLGYASNLGRSWKSFGAQYGQEYLLSLANLGAGVVLCGTGLNAKILKSIDYGRTWADKGTLAVGLTRVYALCHLGNGIVLAGPDPDTSGFAYVFRSTDYGETWIDVGVGFPISHIYCLTYLGNGIALAGGAGSSGATILRSTSYGQTWSGLGYLGGETDIRSLTYLGNGIVLAGTGPHGKILRSTDYGLNWTDLGQQFGEEYILSLCYLDKGIAVAGTSPYAKILHSSNMGLTWSDLGQQQGEGRISAIAYVGKGLVIAGTYIHNYILRSADYGLTWEAFQLPYAEGDISSLCNIGMGTILAGRSLAIYGATMERSGF